MIFLTVSFKWVTDNTLACRSRHNIQRTFAFAKSEPHDFWSIRCSIFFPITIVFPTTKDIDSCYVWPCKVKQENWRKIKLTIWLNVSHCISFEPHWWDRYFGDMYISLSHPGARLLTVLSNSSGRILRYPYWHNSVNIFRMSDFFLENRDVQMSKIMHWSWVNFRPQGIITQANDIRWKFIQLRYIIFDIWKFVFSRKRTLILKYYPIIFLARVLNTILRASWNMT